MTWLAVGGAAVAIVGSYASGQAQKRAGNKAANAQQAAAQASIDEQRRQYEQTRQDMMPFHDAGIAALNRQNAVLNGDYSGFQNSPDYLFALDQGTKFMDRSAASRGSLYSSGHSADMMKYGQGLASQNLNNYWSKLAGQAGQGYQASNALGGYGQQMASNVGNSLQRAGDARASSYLTNGNADSAMWGQVANSGGQILGNYLGGRNSGTSLNANGYPTSGGNGTWVDQASIGGVPQYQNTANLNLIKGW